MDGRLRYDSAFCRPFTVPSRARRSFSHCPTSLPLPIWLVNRKRLARLEGEGDDENSLMVAVSVGEEMGEGEMQLRRVRWNERVKKRGGLRAGCSRALGDVSSRAQCLLHVESATSLPQSISPTRSEARLDAMEHTQIPEDEGVHITGLDPLMRLLVRLKRHGFRDASVDEVWDEVPQQIGRSISSNHSMLGKGLSDLRRSLDEAKLCMAAINEVRDRLGRRIRFLRKECTPIILEEGIKTLPDELLSHVFEAGHGMTGGWTFTKAVSQVSRRFRQVSLGTPLLWTRISPYYSAGQIESFLSRSGQMGLDISTQHAGPERPIYLRHLLPHLKRWTTLRHLDEETENVMRDIGIIDLPRVEALYHHCHFHSYRKLSSLFLGNQHVLSTSPLRHSGLTSLEFEINGHGHFFRSASFAQAVYSMKSLRRLSLTLKDCCPDDHNAVTISDLHSVPIDELHLTVKGRSSYAFVDSCFCSLSFLLASTVHFTLVDVRADDSTPVEFFYSKASEDEMFAYGSVINITALGIKPFDPNGRGLLVWLVEDCKIAHTINLDAPEALFICPSNKEYADVWKRFSALRHLRFTRCDSLTEWELKALVENLMIGANHGEGLQSLEIVNCRGISEECLLELSDEVGSKLNWKL